MNDLKGPIAADCIDKTNYQQTVENIFTNSCLCIRLVLVKILQLNILLHYHTDIYKLTAELYHKYHL